MDTPSSSQLILDQVDENFGIDMVHKEIEMENEEKGMITNS